MPAPTLSRCLALTLALILAAAAPDARAATVVAHGSAPDAVVDRDGVTHLVWNEDRSNTAHQPDVLHYCQIPPGGTACVNAKSFVPPSAGATNTDFFGPHVMVTPFGEVILLTNRCCLVAGRQAPNVLYISDDGGATFGGPTAVGTVPAGGFNGPAPAVFDGADRRVVTVSENGDFQAAPLGQWTEAHAQLGAGAGDSASVVQRERNAFAVAWQDSNRRVWVRTFTCSLDPCPLDRPNNAANWAPAVTLPDAELPRLTTGPAGTFLIYRSTAAATERQFFTRRFDGTALGPALPLGTGGGTNRRDVLEDAGGILHALFTDDRAGLSYRASGDGGVTWGDPQTIVPGADYTIGDVRLAARSTDAGFVGRAFWPSGDGVNPPIVMAELPPPSVSLQVTPPSGGGGGSGPGGPGTPVKVPPSPCRLLTFAAVDVIADACMTREGDAYVATGGVRINGLRVELGGGTLRLNPKQRTITSSGTVTVKVGDAVLFKSRIGWTLPRAAVASLGSIDVSGGGALLGFPLKGSLDIRLRGGGAEIPVHLALPALLGGITGDVTVRADNVAGVHLRELHVRVGDALIGPLELKDLAFDYDADMQSWAGAATLVLPPQPPGPSLAAKIAFSRGELDHLGNELTLPAPGIVLDPFGATYLRKIRFELHTKPTLQLNGGVTITAGPTIAGASAINVDGDLTFTLGNPASLRADGRVSVVGIPLASAFFELRTNGYVAFGGHLGFESGGFRATADVGGWLFKSAFSLDAGASICLGDLGCVGGEVVFSSVGFAGCAKTPIVDFGAGYRWGKSLDIMFSGCDVGPYRAAAAAAQAGGPRSVSFSAGLPAAIVAVQGDGAPPHVALVGPGGVHVEDTPGTSSRTRASIVFHNPQTNTTYFILKLPRPGTWRIVPAPGSAPIAAVQAANGLHDPHVTGSVKRGAGRQRVLSYEVTPLPGQRVTLAEQGAGAARVIGAARNGRSSVRFTPADGPGGRRKIVALVSSYGKPRARLTVATFVAPPPAGPATVRRLKARRSGGRVVVTWAKAARTRRYEVRATVSDGRRIVARQAGTRFTVAGVAARAKVTVSVAGLRSDGARGGRSIVKAASGG